VVILTRDSVLEYLGEPTLPSRRLMEIRKALLFALGF
jgi:hypothetical protein